MVSIIAMCLPLLLKLVGLLLDYLVKRGKMKEENWVNGERIKN